MLLSLSFIILAGMFAGFLCKKLRLPALLGMVLVGILLGPYVFNLLDEKILGISAELRKIALIIILTRAGLTLNISDLKKVGRPAVLMCFVPACFEIGGMLLLAPKLLGVSLIEAAVMGAVVAAVSPAVIVPKMIKLIEEKRGTEKSIPQMILAGASVDDVFVIVLFTAFTGLAQGKEISPVSFVNIPVSIALGALAGIICGWAMSFIFSKFHIRDTAKVLIFLSVSFILAAAEDKLDTAVTFSSLIAVMFIGIAVQKFRKPVAERLSVKFNKLWAGAEIMLFVLVGATVDISSLRTAGLYAACLILGILVFRMAGVFVCLLGTKLNFREKLFCMFAYMPKATVQAAIGGVPLAMGLNCGNTVLTVAVLSIVITAPLGAFLIDMTCGKFLEGK